jgi:general secretion pathway protein J
MLRLISRPLPRPPKPRGFTLIEVMVALVIMAVLAGMAWRGVDALVHSKETAQASTDGTLRLTAGMAQFEYDLSMLTDTGAVGALQFDGANLRMTRRQQDGVQLVVWTLQDGAWQRWASPPATRIRALQDAWLRSQQWSAIAPQAVAVVPGVTAWQVYLFRGNAWTNAQSSADTTTIVDPPAPPSGTASGGGAPGAASAGASAPEGAASAPRARTVTIGATGIRIVLSMPRGDITREKLLPPGGAGAAN